MFDHHGYPWPSLPKCQGVLEYRMVSYVRWLQQEGSKCHIVLISMASTEEEDIFVEGKKLRIVVYKISFISGQVFSQIIECR